ncbi:PREDICTED: uncharacterized protein LOC104159007, partial [Cariama cristata]|uniref:uncharacterized protein LOC104159007 n=1 Tax=Cariama cristata TaxID=54380 RepID=UPI0005203EEB
YYLRVVYKALQDFLRSIPTKLLMTDLYEDWMAAMQKAGKEEKTEELKAVSKKLPAANLLLLKWLLSLLQHIGHNATTSRMSCSNLAICLGPNLLSPPDEELLPLEAMLEVTEKAPPALPSTSPESEADSLGHPEELASLSEDRRCKMSKSLGNIIDPGDIITGASLQPLCYCRISCLAELQENLHRRILDLHELTVATDLSPPTSFPSRSSGITITITTALADKETRDFGDGNVPGFRDEDIRDKEISVT